MPGCVMTVREETHMTLFRWLVPLLLLAGGALIGWAWLGQGAKNTGSGSNTAKAGLLRPDDARLVAMGEKIYARACASCHGANLEGQPGWRTKRGLAPAHDETGHTWHHPDTLLLRIVREGTVRMGGRMPGFKGVLTEEEMLAVLSYIKSRWPARIRQTHDTINARAAAGNG